MSPCARWAATQHCHCSRPGWIPRAPSLPAELHPSLQAAPRAPGGRGCQPEPCFAVSGRGRRRWTAETRRPDRGRQRGGPGRSHPRAGCGHPEAPEGHGDPGSAVLRPPEFCGALRRAGERCPAPQQSLAKRGSAFPPRISSFLQVFFPAFLPALRDFWWLWRFLWTSFN